MAKRLTLALAMLTLVATIGFAGDVATFVNLGFSSDSRVFMFGQYGIDAEDTYPYAELYTVDVANNSFLDNGVKRRSFELEPTPGQNGQGALFTMLENNRNLVRSNDIGHLRKGRIIYLLVNGEEPKSDIAFRDFETGNRFEVKLVQVKRPDTEPPSASFHIQLTAYLGDDDVKAYTVGRPGYQREDVLSYKIRKIILSPDQRSLVFVVEKETAAENGSSVRYMVETVRFR